MNDGAMSRLFFTGWFVLGIIVGSGVALFTAALCQCAGKQPTAAEMEDGVAENETYYSSTFLVDAVKKLENAKMDTVIGNPSFVDPELQRFVVAAHTATTCAKPCSFLPTVAQLEAVLRALGY